MHHSVKGRYEIANLEEQVSNGGGTQTDLKKKSDR